MSEPSRRRRRRNSINPDAASHRGALRAGGFVLLGVGAVFAAVGVIDFFSSFSAAASGQARPPTRFWCVFVGFPLIALGAALLKFGYMGAVARYAAGEIAPVATDSVNYVGKGARPGVRAVTSAIAAGLRDVADGDTAARVACPKCGQDNDRDARFCDQCGHGLATAKACPECEAENELDAKFCDECGARFRT